MDLVQTGKVKIHDGSTERCTLDGADVDFNFDNGAQTFVLTTDGIGRLPVAESTVSAKHSVVRITVFKTGYKTVSVKGTVSWVGDLGTIGIEAIFLVKK